MLSDTFPHALNIFQIQTKTFNLYRHRNIIIGSIIISVYGIIYLLFLPQILYYYIVLELLQKFLNFLKFQMPVMVKS